jgi:hypothetical protein
MLQIQRYLCSSSALLVLILMVGSASVFAEEMMLKLTGVSMMVFEDGKAKMKDVNVQFDEKDLSIKGRRPYKKSYSIPYNTITYMGYEISRSQGGFRHWFTIQHALPDSTKESYLFRLIDAEQRKFRHAIFQKTGKEYSVILVRQQ